MMGEHQGSADSLSQNKDLTFKWFIECQLSHMCKNGSFPNWFLGFVCRKEAEEILKDKELGCFLIRLSDKTIGYVLTYKGVDRCRHFVIAQKSSGQFVITGDVTFHDTLVDLIDFYKTRAIEPFGEYLTSPCCQCTSEELYDSIFSDTIPVVSSRAAVRKQHPRQPPTPPQSHPTCETSMAGKRFEKQETPPLPLRRQFDSSPECEPDKVVYAQLRKKTKKAERASQDLILRKLTPLVDCRSRSLPALVMTFDEQHTYRLSAPAKPQPGPSPTTIRQTESYGPRPPTTTGWGIRETCSYSLDHLSHRVVYHQTSVGPQEEPVYAEAFTGLRRDTYNIDPEEETVNHEPNTYEALEDVKPTNNNPWKTMIQKWKRLFADAKKKP